MLSAPALDLLISGWLDCPGCGRAGRILQLLTSTSHPPSFSEWWVHLRIQTLQTSSAYQSYFDPTSMTGALCPRPGRIQAQMRFKRLLPSSPEASVGAAAASATEQAQEKRRLTPMCPHQLNRLLKTPRLRRSPQSTLQERCVSGCLQRYTEAQKAQM